MLDADLISVSFGGVRAVSNVSLSLGDELLGLVGPNGSGKTTFLNAVSGVVPATGRLVIDGSEVPLGRPRSSWKAGTARVFQAPQTFEALSVLENVLLASSDGRWRGGIGTWIARPAMMRAERTRWVAAHEALELVGLGAEATHAAGLLSYGQQRLLELARAISGSPKVLLLDEPSAGLNDAETNGLADLLLEVRRTGLPMLLIDHKVDFLDRLCDRLVVLELGEVVAQGTPEDVWSDQRVINAYLGAPTNAGG